MPSDENGRDFRIHVNGPPSSGERAPASGEGPPPSAPYSAPPSSSGPPPAEFVAWGPVRDAVTSIHNLEALLKSPRVGSKVLGEVLPEFLAGVSALREAFATSATTAKDARTGAARAELCAFAHARLDELATAMQSASTGDLDTRGRLRLEQVVRRVSVDLDSSAELLDLSERAEHAVPAELSLDEITRVSLRGSSARRGHEAEIPVRLARSVRSESVLRVDPHVLKRLIAFAVARVHAGGAGDVTIRAAYAAGHAELEIAATTPAEALLASTPMRLVRRVDPTDAIADAAASAAGLTAKAATLSIAFAVPRAG